jgi:hypothetical protein
MTCALNVLMLKCYIVNPIGRGLMSRLVCHRVSEALKKRNKRNCIPVLHCRLGASVRLERSQKCHYLSNLSSIVLVSDWVARLLGFQVHLGYMIDNFLYSHSSQSTGCSMYRPSRHLHLPICLEPFKRQHLSFQLTRKIYILNCMRRMRRCLVRTSSLGKEEKGGFKKDGK